MSSEQSTSGASFVPDQPRDEVESDLSATSKMGGDGSEAIGTDLTAKTAVPGTRVARDDSTRSEKEAEQDIAEGSIVRDERAQTVATGIPHPVVPERNPVIEVPRRTCKEEIISRARGGKIASGGCGVKFPSGILKHDAKIKITVESGAVSDRSTKGITISPTLSCDLSHVELVPGYKMEVEILSYCFAREPIRIALLSKTSDSEDWVIEKEMMLGRDRKLKFKTSSFSRQYFAFMRFIGMESLLIFPITPHLYYNKFGVFKSYLCIDDKAVIDGLKAEHKSRGFASALVMPEPLIANLNESIGVELQCAHPPPASFGDDDHYELMSDDLINNAYVQKDFVLKNIPDRIARGFVEIRLTLAKIPPDQTPRPMRSRLEWPML